MFRFELMVNLAKHNRIISTSKLRRHVLKERFTLITYSGIVGKETYMLAFNN